MTTDNISSIVASGPIWAGVGTRSLESSLREVIMGANSEFHMVVYSASFAIFRIFDMLEPRLAAGVRTTMILNRANRSSQLSVIHRLNLIARRFPDSRILSFEPRIHLRNLHAKAVVADRIDAIIGSANLSLRGMMENYELGIRVHGEVAKRVSILIDRLSEDDECISFPLDD